jgi:probable rRNA maturation factor
VIILERKIAGLGAASLARFVLRAQRAARLQGSVNILVTGNAEMRSLNLQFRKKDNATDVLSFPSESRNGLHNLAGEIAISADIASNNAVRYGHSAAIEVKVLALHGILHLAGFDHESDNGRMARKEAALRRMFGLPSSLTERGASGRQKRSHPQGPSRSKTTRRTA